MSPLPIAGRFPGLLLVVVLVSSTTPAGAQSAPVTEREFVGTVNANHPWVVARTSGLAEAEGTHRAAGTLPNPILEFEREAPTNGGDQSTLKLWWQPPLDGRRGLAADAAEAGLDAATADVEWIQLDVRQELRQIFADWALADRRRSLLSEHLQGLESLQDRLEARAERGEESRLSAQRFALAVTDVRVELAQAEADLVHRRAAALATRADLTSEAVPVLPRTPAAPASLGDHERPDLRGRRHEVDAAMLKRRLAGRVLRFPSLAFGWTRISSSDEDAEGPWFGVSWEAPLFQRDQGERARATRDLAAAEARLRRAEREAEETGAAALTAYEQLHATLDEVESVAETAPDVASAARDAFLAGESSMTDLLETLRSVLSSQLAALDLKARALEAHRELERSAGRVLTQGGER